MLFGFLASPLRAEPSDEISQKKTILVLSSRGGYGHTAAANTLQKLIGDRYELKVIHPIDQLRIWGVPSGEQFYNMMLKRGWIRSMNFLARHIAPRLFRSRTHKLEKIINSYIRAYQPDLIISLIPYINYPASEAARKQDIPFLLVTTDNDLRNWSYGLEKVSHPNFKVTIGSDLPTTRGILLRKKIPDTSIETIGLPLRPDFISERDAAQIREEYHIPAGKPIILIMMGGAGNKSAYDYARKIGEMDLSTHVIVCTGRNDKLRKELMKIRLHASNSMTIFGFTDKIADLMAISDLIITKPGPGTINEAIAMHLPILIDHIDASLFWERANSEMVVKYGIGQKINDYREMRKVIRGYLADRAWQDAVEESFTVLPSNQFHERIGKIVDSMIQIKQEREVTAPSAFPVEFSCSLKAL
jgi:UDP-N-acetylglucosamine:LPS N-acetylglucosamine transferase